MSFRKWKEDQLELTDPRAMRALAHPVRLALLGALASAPRTATECAEVVGESPSSCSYHLRSLARWGLVERAEARNGKERPWRKVKGGLNWQTGVDPEASRALSASFLGRDWERLREYLAAPPESWPEPMYSQATLKLTAEEAEELSQRLFDVLEPYFPANRPEAPEGAQDIWFVTFGVPYAP